jgi:hypothetical protein
LITDVPIDVDRDTARDAAARELADPAYQAAEPSLLERALIWLLQRLAELFQGAAALTPGGPLGLVLLALVVAAVVVIVRLRTGGISRTRRGERALFDGRPRSADEHRRAADDAVSRGDLTAAVRERFRAIVRELEQRGVLDELSGRTVDEIAAQAGARLPGCADELREAARIFDDVIYGGRNATVDGYHRLVAVDDLVRTERPTLLGASR